MADNIFTQEQQQQVFELFNAMGSLAKETDPLTQAHKEAAIAAKKLKDEHERLRKQLGDSALNFGKTLFSTGQGLGKFSSSIEGAAGAAGGLVKSFSGLGKAAGALGVAIQAIGSLVGAALRQNDQLMESYRNLSDMGTVASGGLENLRDQLHRVGLVSAEAEKFERALRPVTHQLALLGGSVSMGREQLVELTSRLIGPNNELERSLARIGYSSQDIREGAADFMQRQAMMGISMNKNTQEQTMQVRNYLVTLKELQELTGMSRDEAQKALDMQLADARMNIFLGELKEEERENLRFYLAAYEKNFGKEAAAGLKEMIVNQGMVVGTLSAQTFQSTFGTAYPQAMRVMRMGRDQTLGALKTVADANYRVVGSVRGAYMALGDEMKELSGASEMVNGSLRLRAMSEENFRKQQDSLLRTLEGEEGQLENSILAEQKARSFRIAGDQAVGSVANLVTKAFHGLLDVMHSFAKFLAKFIDGMTNSAIGKYFGLTPTNLSAQFRDMEDTMSDLNTNAEEQLRTQQEMVRIQQQLVDLQNPNAKEQITKQVSTLKDNQDALLAKINITSGEERKKLIKEHLENENILKQLRERLVNLNKNTIPGANRTQALTQQYQSATSRSGELRNQEATLREEQSRISGEAVPQVNVPAGGGRGSMGGPTADDIKRHNLEEQLNKIFNFNSSDTGSRSHFNMLDPAFKEKVIKAALEYHEATNGKKITVNSSSRSYQEQERIYKKALEEGKTAAKPGTSMHEKGRAIDVQEWRDTKLQEIFKKHGITHGYPRSGKTDVPHFQARTGGLFSGPESGYPVMLHGKEAVIRLDNLQKLLKNNQEAPADSTVSKSSITGELQNAMTSDNTGSKNDALIQIMSVAVDKLDQVVEHTRRNSQIQDELLTVARVK
jgi:hypothetical protein